MEASSVVRREQIRPMTIALDNGMLDLPTFIKAFVATLVENRVDAVYPHDSRDIAGFKAVVAELDRELERAHKGKVKEAILPLLNVVNELRPSNTGSFDGFEAALRSLQLTFTSSPNPFFNMIQFPVSRGQAKIFIEQLPPKPVILAQNAARAFMEARRQARA